MQAGRPPADPRHPGADRGTSTTARRCQGPSGPASATPRNSQRHSPSEQACAASTRQQRIFMQPDKPIPAPTLTCEASSWARTEPPFCTGTVPSARPAGGAQIAPFWRCSGRESGHRSIAPNEASSPVRNDPQGHALWSPASRPAPGVAILRSVWRRTGSWVNATIPGDLDAKPLSALRHGSPPSGRSPWLAPKRDWREAGASHGRIRRLARQPCRSGVRPAGQGVHTCG